MLLFVIFALLYYVNRRLRDEDEDRDATDDPSDGPDESVVGDGGEAGHGDDGIG